MGLGHASPLSTADLSSSTEALAIGFEEFIFGTSWVLGPAVLFFAFASRTHPLYRRNTVDEGIVSLSIIAALAWVVYAIMFHSDPSVQGFYALSYFMMGAALVPFLGSLTGLLVAGIRDIDIRERDGMGAALVQGSLILSIGLIFGGSVWGEADPHSDDEGGWWIPVLFFVNGWAALVLLAIIGWRRVVRDIGSCLRNKKELPRLASFSMYLISCALIIFSQVSGDFHGWSHGISAVLATAVLLVVQELMVIRHKFDPKSHNLLVEFLAMSVTVIAYFWSDSLFTWLSL